MLRFQEQESATDFEYTARDNAKKSFSATQELELVKYFKQTAKLHYGHTEEETLKLAFQCGKGNNIWPSYAGELCIE